MKRAVSSFLVLLLLAISSVVRAQAPSTMSYQGVLTDASGLIVGDGPYNLTFRIYDVASGGAPLWTETHTGVVVERGGFSVVLGSGTPIALAFDKRYWLGVQVFAEPELAPRVELASSPYALSLRLPFSQTLASSSPLLTLDNTDAAGQDAVFKGRVDVGTSASSGDLRIFRSAGVGTSGRFYAGTHGANIDLFEEGGSVHSVLQGDANGEGGFFQVYRDPPFVGFQVDGNSGGTFEPAVAVLGSARSAVFNMSQSGDASVSIPNDAISAAEMFDEPGVGSRVLQTSVSISSSPLVFAARTITCPSSGFVVAIGSAQVSAAHATGSTSGCVLGVSNIFETFTATGDMAVALPPAAPSGSYTYVVTPQAVFPVSAGNHTFYLVAQATSGSWSMIDRQLTVMFFPTAYGTVEPPGPGGPAAVEHVGASGAPLSGAELARERDEAQAFNTARLQRELEEMRAKLAQVERQVREAAAEQARTSAAAAAPR